ncbi:solute carrier family 22 member 18 isoform X19 [Sagmatias obliquidens]|uniref:solute carrier family 22 member 18 isoform X19 n=1 Tax=Sagmatias obliquidens TaxID=3371155 RepID=UPI000F43E86F|nr:solute carrier family 22 member 18 isoform X19 [Lagenorhynchus obliquidens]
MGPRSHGEGLEMPRPASPSSPTGPLRAACLLPHDSAPLPSSAGLLPPALSSSLLFGSLRGLPATPAQDAGSQGLQGPGPVPQQDWHSGPVPGHAARVRAGSPGARLPLHAVLSHAIPVPEAGPGLCCLRLPADHLWRASAVGRARVWQRSTCSWLSPAARPCPACPYSLPRACPAPSCTRCQVGPAAQMAITDLSAPEERPAALGRLGLCFGVGVIFGSLLGGTLSSTCGIQCPVIVALVVSLLGAVLSFTCIPTSTKGASARAQAALPGESRPPGQRPEPGAAENSGPRRRRSAARASPLRSALCPTLRDSTGPCPVTSVPERVAARWLTQMWLHRPGGGRSEGLRPAPQGPARAPVAPALQKVSLPRPVASRASQDSPGGGKDGTSAGGRAHSRWN